MPESAPSGPNVIDIHYKIEEGDRAFVERINITGNTRTKDKVIRREVLVAPGDIFNTVRVESPRSASITSATSPRLKPIRKTPEFPAAKT